MITTPQFLANNNNGPVPAGTGIPPAVAMQPKPEVYIHLETTNSSFVEMHHLLKALGIKNNAFMLSLYDTDLIGVDPYDPNLSYPMKLKILRECMINYWYFIREVVRLPESGGQGNGARYKLNRGNLAISYLLTLNFNIFAELPRQQGKSVCIRVYSLWILNFGTTNSEIMFIHKNHGGSKENLSYVKRYRELLPPYLRFDAPISDATGKRLKVPNTAEVLQHPSNHNRIKTLPSAKNKQLANTLGRGCTQPIQWYDEFGWIVHNELIYNSATPAFDTASQVAKKHNAPHGIILTTTPGDMTTQEGLYANKVRNNSTRFIEKYYDFSYEELEKIVESNKSSIFFYVRYSYKELGLSEEYFDRMVKELQRDWAIIRREVLLEWTEVNTNNPFDAEDLDVIKQYCHEPIRTILFGPYRQYQMHIYDDVNLLDGQIIGVDVSGGYRRDSSAITVINAKTTKVMATLNSNSMPTDDLASVLVELVTKYLPNALVCVEKNGVGIGVISRLIHTSIKRNLYYVIKDHVAEERSNGVLVQQQKVKVKAYGIDNTKDVRARMIELLFTRVQYHKDKFIAPAIHTEMCGLCYRTTNGHTRVDHSINSHDDQIFSYLMAIYVWYDCPDLETRFHILRGEIQTDDSQDEKVGAIEDINNGTYELQGIVDSTEPVDTDTTVGKLAAGLKTPYKTIQDVMDEEYEKDQRALAEVLRTPLGADAIKRAYGVDLTQTNAYILSNHDFGNVPQSIFDDWYGDTSSSHVDNGNLGDVFQHIDMD